MQKTDNAHRNIIEFGSTVLGATGIPAFPTPVGNIVSMCSEE
jgi:hypothetical protein